MKNIIKKREEVYEHYFEADDDARDNAYDNPPADAHHSDLRDYYTLVQQKRQCLESNHNMPIEKPEQILALIFFKNVGKNYCAFYKDEITRIQVLLGAKAIPEGGADCQDWSRKTWLTFIKDFRQKLVGENPVPEADEKAYHRLYRAIYISTCVPTTWITDPPAPGQHPAAPQTSCIDSTKDD